VTADASGSTDTDATPISTYTFDFGDGYVVPAQAQSTAKHTYRAAGTYWVRVTVTDTAGKRGHTEQIVTVATGDSPPVAMLRVSPTSGPGPLLVVAYGSGSTDTDATPISTFTFDFGDGYVVGPQSSPKALHTYKSAGTYTITLTVTDTAALTGQDTQIVTVTNP
jgi:PKD repeat protein